MIVQMRTETIRTLEPAVTVQTEAEASAETLTVTEERKEISETAEKEEALMTEMNAADAALTEAEETEKDAASTDRIVIMTEIAVSETVTGAAEMTEEEKEKSHLNQFSARPIR